MEDSIEHNLKKIENYIENKEYYVALQYIKSINYRYTLIKKYEESDKLLFGCIKLFINTTEDSSSIELVKLYISLIEKSHSLKKDQLIYEVCFIIDNVDLSISDWDTVIAKFLKWSERVNDDQIEIKLQASIANSYIKAHRCSEARFHSFFINDSLLLTEIMVKYSLVFIYPEELDLFVLQVVLQILKKLNFTLASGFFYNFIRTHSGFNEASEFPYHIPLFNFIHLTFRSLSAKSYDQFVLLGKLYEPLLNLDPYNIQNFEEIKVLFFPSNIPSENNTNSRAQTSTQSTSSSLINLINSLLPAMNLNSSSASTPSTPSTSSHSSETNETQPSNNINDLD